MVREQTSGNRESGFHLGHWKDLNTGEQYWVASTPDLAHEGIGPTSEDAMAELLGMLCRRIHVLEVEIERFSPRR